MRLNTLCSVAAVGTAMVLMTGCVSEEEFNAKVDALATANKTIEALENDLENEMGKLKDKDAELRTEQIQRQDAEAKVADLEKRLAQYGRQMADAEAAQGEVEQRLMDTKKNLNAEKRAKEKAQGEYKELTEEYAKLLDKFNQYRENLAAISAAAPTQQAAPIAVPTTPAKASTPVKAVKAPQKVSQPSSAIDSLVKEVDEMIAK